MISSFRIEEILKDRGFTLAASDSRRYARGLRHATLPDPLYVKANAKKGKPVAVNRYPLVIHPDRGVVLTHLAKIPGVHAAADPYHNSNLAGFPVRDNGGKKEICYGRAVQFADDAALHAFVDALLR